MSEVKLYVAEVNDLHTMLAAVRQMLDTIGPKLQVLYPDSIEIKLRHDGGERDTFLIFWDPEQEDFRVEVLP